MSNCSLFLVNVRVNIQALTAAWHKNVLDDVVVIAVGQGPVDHGRHHVVSLRTLTPSAPLSLAAHTGTKVYAQVERVMYR